MARTINSATLTALEQQTIRPFIALEIYWPSGGSTTPLRVWTGWGDIVFQGVTWGGLGQLLQVNAIEETSTMAVRGLRIKLDGLNSTLLDYVVGTDFQGNDCQLYFGVMDDNSAIIGDPVSVFQGYLDAATISESAKGSIIDVTAESRMLDFQRANKSRYTVQDQTNRSGLNDKCFEFLPLMGTTAVAWGNHNSE